MPAAFVFVIETRLKDGFTFVIVIGDVPPNMTLPVLMNDTPSSLIVAPAENGGEGVKRSSPLLVTVPLLVKFPKKVWISAPPLKDAPAAMLHAK